MGEQFEGEGDELIRLAIKRSLMAYRARIRGAIDAVEEHATKSAGLLDVVVYLHAN